MDLSITISNFTSVTSPIVLQGEYIEQITIASQLGYKYAEFHIRDPKDIDRKLLMKTLASTGMKVTNIGTGQAYVQERIYFSSLDKTIRQLAVERIRDQIKFASELGADVIIGSVKGPLPPEQSQTGAARDRVQACLEDCLNTAVKYDVHLTLEAINRYETNFLNTAAQTVEFIQKIGSPLLELHLDTFHMNIEEVSIEETIRKYADYLKHIHLADSNRLAPGLGHLDFAKIIDTLREIHYQGYLGIECLAGTSAIETAKQSLRHIGPLL